ncbi:MAG: SymE family type I addiction module toxin [Pseudomonadota bacterium]
MAKRTITPELRSPQEKSFYTRKLKVREGFYDYETRSTRNSHKLLPHVPFMLLKGYWLNKAGFPIGTAVCINVHKGCLVIRATQNAP